MKLKNNDSPFKKEKNRNEALNKKLVAVFAAAFVLILAGSLFAILAKNDFNLLSAISGEVVTEAGEEEEDSPAGVSVPKSDKYWLLYCNDTETGELRLMWIARLRLPQRYFNILAPSIQTVTEYGEEMISFNYIFKTYGADALKKAVEKEYKIRISNCMSADVNNFKSMINYIGGITFDVPEKVEYRDEFNLFLIEGKNTMKGDPVYKYLLWLGFGQGENINIRSEVLAEIFRTVFTGNNAAKTDAFYSKLANSVTTDFSIVDYRANAEIIKYVFEKGPAKITVAENLNQLTGKK